MLTLTGQTGTVNKWQWAESPFTTWNDITNTNVTYISGALPETTEYRAIVQSGACSALTSGTTTVTVDPVTVAGSVTGGTEICTGSPSGVLTLEDNTGTVNKWQWAVAPFTTWNDIANTATTYTSGALTATTEFRAVVQSGLCGTLTSATTTVTVDPVTVAGNVTGGTEICTGSPSGVLTLGGNTGSVIKWQWAVSPFSSWTDIANTSTTYTSGALTATTEFRAVVQSGVCGALNSGTTTVTVDPATVAGSVTGGTEICTGSPSGVLTLSGNTGTVNKWQWAVAPFTTWNDITNTDVTYTSGVLTATTEFRAVVQSGLCGTLTSATTTVTVDPATIAGNVTEVPESVQVLQAEY